MAISITHAFVSGKADPPDASLIKPSNWNAGHVLTMGTGKLVGRTTAASGAAEEIAVSGALTFTAQTLSLPVNAIGNTYLADMATQTIKGRTTAATGDPEDLTVTQVTAMLNTFTTSLKGLVPASGGGTTNFLRADGTWAAPPSANAQTVLDTLSTTRGAMVFRGSGGWTALTPNTAGYVLRDNGSGSDPSWVGGMTLLSSGTASAVSTLDLALPSGYRFFKLFINNILPSISSSLNARFSVDGGSSYPSGSSAYSYAYYYSSTSPGTNPPSGSGATSGLMYIIGQIAASILAVNCEVTIYPGASGTYQPTLSYLGMYSSSGVFYSQAGMGQYGASGPATHIRLLMGSGTLTCQYALYGII